MDTDDDIRIAQILRESMVNGVGVRLVVAFQGCSIRCPGCHNSELQDHNGGYLASIKDILSNVTDLTSGITLSGGEPTEQPLKVARLLEAAKKLALDTMLYTGLTKEQWLAHPFCNLMSQNLDYIKIGPYDESKRDLSASFVGSTNQRIYKVVKGELENCE